jgi:SAM-dependent methyltransferase
MGQLPHDLCEPSALHLPRRKDAHDRGFAMSLRTRIFAATYDRQIAKVERAGLRAYREGLVTQARGKVLEIGAGTGANVPYYGPEVESLIMTEPEPSMLRRLRDRAKQRAVESTVLRAPAEDLPFEDATFNVVVSTMVLCGVNDQPRALREIHRVLKPGGRLLFLEHVRATDPRLNRRQDRMNWLNRFLVGCDCNRPTLDSIQAAGFEVTDIEHTVLPKVPTFVSPLVIGTATTIPDRRYPEKLTEGNYA